MRKRIVLVVVALAALAGGGVWVYPREAQCAYCTKNDRCTTTVGCGGEGCVCLKKGGEFFGSCVSLN